MTAADRLHTDRVPTPSSRRPDIQGMRGLAVVLVVIYHAGLPLRGGFVGVDVFFVISGFVIAGMLLAELESKGRLDLGQFYLRRIRRLLPALAVASAAVAGLAVLASPLGTQVTAAFTSMAASLFMANAYLYRAAPGYFSPGADLNPMLHTWSLAVEEQFYVLFPSLLAVAWRLPGSAVTPRTRRRSALLVVLAIMGASLWLSLAMSEGRNVIGRVKAPTNFAFYSSPTRAWEFGAGVLLALTTNRLAGLRPAMASATGVVGFALVLAASALFGDSTNFPGWAALVPVLGTALMIIGGSAGENRMTRLLSTRPAVWIGDRSYSWYLWHWPFVVFGRALFPDSQAAPLIAASLSIIPAWASYRFVENPIRFAKQPTWPRTLRLAAICVATPILMSAGLVWVHGLILASPAGIRFQRAIELHADAPAMPPAGQDQANTTVGGGQQASVSKGSILLLGDSNAGQFTEPIARAAAGAGYELKASILPACPYASLIPFQGGVANRACQDFVAASLADIEARPPALVILAAASDSYIEETSTTFAPIDGGRIAKNPEDKARLWSSGLAAVLVRLTRVAPVLLVHPIPRFHGWSLEGCAAARVLVNLESCGRGTTKMRVEAWRKRAVEGERLAVAGAPGAVGLDLIDALCSGTDCPVNRNGEWSYRDGGHLSVRGAVALSGDFAAALDAMGFATSR